MSDTTPDEIKAARAEFMLPMLAIEHLIDSGELQKELDALPDDEREAALADLRAEWEKLQEPMQKFLGE